MSDDVREILGKHFGGPDAAKPTTIEMARLVSARLTQLYNELLIRGVATSEIRWPGTTPTNPIGCPPMGPE